MLHAHAMTTAVSASNGRRRVLDSPLPVSSAGNRCGPFGHRTLSDSPSFVDDPPTAHCLLYQTGRGTHSGDSELRLAPRSPGRAACVQRGEAQRNVLASSHPPRHLPQVCHHRADRSLAQSWRERPSTTILSEQARQQTPKTSETQADVVIAVRVGTPGRRQQTSRNEKRRDLPGWMGVST